MSPRSSGIGAVIACQCRPPSLVRYSRFPIRMKPWRASGNEYGMSGYPSREMVGTGAVGVQCLPPSCVTYTSKTCVSPPDLPRRRPKTTAGRIPFRPSNRTGGRVPMVLRLWPGGGDNARGCQVRPAFLLTYRKVDPLPTPHQQPVSQTVVWLLKVRPLSHRSHPSGAP